MKKKGLLHLRIFLCFFGSNKCVVMSKWTPQDIHRAVWYCLDRWSAFGEISPKTLTNFYSHNPTIIWLAGYLVRALKTAKNREDADWSRNLKDTSFKYEFQSHKNVRENRRVWLETNCWCLSIWLTHSPLGRVAKKQIADVYPYG